MTYTPDLAFENDTSVSAIREGDWANLRYKQMVVVVVALSQNLEFLQTFGK